MIPLIALCAGFAVGVFVGTFAARADLDSARDCSRAAGYLAGRLSMMADLRKIGTRTWDEIDGGGE